MFSNILNIEIIFIVVLFPFLRSNTAGSLRTRSLTAIPYLSDIIKVWLFSGRVN